MDKLASFLLRSHLGSLSGFTASQRQLSASKRKEVFVRIDVMSQWPGTGSGMICPAPARGRPGYTFIEVLVATWLLTFVVVALYAAFAFGFSVIKLSQEDVRANQILLQKLETLRIYDWSKITNGYIPTNFTAAFSTNGGVTYEGAIAINPVPLTESYSNTLRQVTVSLSWVSTGVPRNRSVTTLVSQNGIQTYKP